MASKKRFALTDTPDGNYGLWYADEKGRHYGKLLATIYSADAACEIINKLNKR